MLFGVSGDTVWCLCMLFGVDGTVLCLCMLSGVDDGPVWCMCMSFGVDEVPNFGVAGVPHGASFVSVRATSHW